MTTTPSLLDTLAALVRSQTAGIGLASGTVLLMLALSFLVGHRLRPNWGLRWMALAMLMSALRGWASAAGLSTEAWRPLMAGLAAIGLSALVTGLRRYVGRDRWQPWLEFLGFFLLWQVFTRSAQWAGLGLTAGVMASTLIYLYLAALCVPGLRAVAGQAHRLAAGALVLNPLLVVAVGMGLLGLEVMSLHSWSVMSHSLVGLGLMMATAGRLRIELQAELEGRQRAEAALRALNESLEQRIQDRTEELQGLVDGLESFNRMVSHDLRGPLGGLNGVAQLARDALARQDLARAGQMLDLIHSETGRLSTLVTQLLLLARVSHADLALRVTPLDEVLAQALQTLALSEGRERLDRVQADPLPRAEVDAQLVQQVFINLIGNALKFSERQARPEVRVRESTTEAGGRQVVVEVRDNGPGFDPAQAETLFQPFRRLHGREVEGHGIGLTIVRRIVERHGGRVWAESQPGQGARFYFSLPQPGTSLPPGA